MKIVNRYHFGVAALFMILGLAASCTRNLSVTPSVVVTLNTPTFTNTTTPANTNTPTNTLTLTNTITNTPAPGTPTFTGTPTNTGTSTFTPTNTGTFTFTNTPTNTPTNTATNTFTPAPTIKFENWEGPYPSGNMWSGFSTCASASYICNPASSGEAITTCYDSTGGDAHSGTYCWKSTITWNTCGPTQYAQEGLDSAYGGDYGFPISIAASVPTSVSFWVKSDTAGQQFTVYMQDTTGPGSGSPAHTTFFQNGTGANVLFSITTAGVWQNIQLPLQPANMWSVDCSTLNWAAILDIGHVWAAPPTCAPGQVVTWYDDDYGFAP